MIMMVIYSSVNVNDRVGIVIMMVISYFEGGIPDRNRNTPFFPVSVSHSFLRNLIEYKSRSERTRRALYLEFLTNLHAEAQASFCQASYPIELA